MDIILHKIETKEQYDEVIAVMQRELAGYIKRSGLKSLVLGISGGIDSAICAALAKPVCDELQIPLIGRYLSIETNKPDEEDRAIRIGENFCTNFQALDLTHEYNAIKQLYNMEKDMVTFEEEEPGVMLPREENIFAMKIRHGNIKARLRMTYLFDLAQKNKGLVLSTDNLTELFLGFWTLHGDVGNYGMIQNLWKTEVYQLSIIFANELPNSMYEGKRALLDCVKATPTDGLGITNSDLEQLGASSYDEVDNILQSYFENPRAFNDLNPSSPSYSVISRMIKTEFKRNDPYSIPRKVLLNIHQ